MRTIGPDRPIAWVRASRGVGAVLLLAGSVMVSCGPAATVRIPPAQSTGQATRPSPTASVRAQASSTDAPLVSVAPGVAAPAAELVAPRFTVSRQFPPPAGTPVGTVVADFIRDNYIENVALERADPRLLRYAVAGNLLAAMGSEIESNAGPRVTRIVDRFTAIVAGRKEDPNNSRVDIALIVSGVETESQMTSSGEHATTRSKFQELVWCEWVPRLANYLLVDAATK